MTYKVVRVNGAVVAFGPNDDSYEPSQAYTVEDEAPLPNQADALRAQIRAIEVQELTPRNTREALIYLAEKEAIAVAAQLGATPEQVLAANIGYQNAKAIDLQITALRAQIQALE